MDNLLSHLPDGDIQYVRAPDNRWEVAIYERGQINRLETVATGMDKSVAAWLAHKLRETKTPKESTP